jgi:oligosaccharyl transferase (archaeosortase A-associated)
VNLSKINPKLIAIVILFLVFALALSLRVFLPQDRIFSAEGIKYCSSDAYYNIRQVDNLAYNFPNHTKVDPYLIYPGASGGVHPRFFAWLLATLSWIFGLGSPTEHVIDLVGIFTPAILGALIVVPVYVIGKELFSRWAGLFSALLVAILPGEFMGRTILGFTDYHVAESLFTTLTMMFLVLAVKEAGRRQLTYSHARHPEWPVLRRTLIYSLLAGFFLSLYLFTWAGGLLFVFIIFLYFLVQLIIDHIRKKPAEYLCFVSVPLFVVPLVLSPVVAVGLMMVVASLVIALIVPVILCALSWYFHRVELRSGYYPLAIVVLGAVGLGLLYLATPSLTHSMLNAFTAYIPKGAHVTTIEMQPLFTGIYGNPLTVVWGNFPGIVSLDTSTPDMNFRNFFALISSTFFMSLIALCLLIYIIARRDRGEKVILVIWSLVILACILLQRRFGYYFAVNVSLLTGYLCWMILRRVGLKEGGGEEDVQVKEVPAKKTRPRPKKSDSSILAGRFVIGVTLVIILGVVYPGNIEPTTVTASRAQYAPSDAWVSSLKWLKENTPEPFGDPNSYYQIFEAPPPGKRFQYPDSAYGVLAWWDYGYWITRIAHRLPIANPSQDEKVLTRLGEFFTSQDDDAAEEILDKMNADNEFINDVKVDYVIVDYETAYIDPGSGSSKFPAVTTWAGKDQSDYFDYYLMPAEDGQRYVLRPLFHTAYYNSLLVRLYNFGGQAVTPESSWVVSYKEAFDTIGTRYLQLTGAEQFTSYEEAETYIASQNSTNMRIVSPNPKISPVPLEAVENYRLIHESENMVTLADNTLEPAVKIFEHIK